MSDGSAGRTDPPAESSANMTDRQYTAAWYSSQELAKIMANQVRILQLLEGPARDGEVTLAVLGQRVTEMARRLEELCHIQEVLTIQVAGHEKRITTYEERSGFWAKIQAALTLIVAAVAGWLATHK